MFLLMHGSPVMSSIIIPSSRSLQAPLVKIKTCSFILWCSLFHLRTHLLTLFEISCSFVWEKLFWSITFCPCARLAGRFYCRLVEILYDTVSVSQCLHLARYTQVNISCLMR